MKSPGIFSRGFFTGVKDYSFFLKLTLEYPETVFLLFKVILELQEIKLNN